jgi:hypothetical protein
MSENKQLETPHDPAVQIFTHLSRLLDVSAGALVLAGVLILFAGTGRIRWGSYVIEFSRFAPSFVPVIAVVFACALLTLGAYLLISRRTQGREKICLGIMTTILMAVVLGWAGYTVFVRNGSADPFDSWAYDFPNKRFRVQLDADALSQYDGKALFLVVRHGVDSGSGEFGDYDGLLVESWKPSSGTLEYTVNSKNVGPVARIGDKVEVHLFAVPRGTDMTQLASDTQVIENGGEGIWMHYHYAAVEELSVDALAAAFDQLSPGERKLFTEAVLEQPRLAIRGSEP